MKLYRLFMVCFWMMPLLCKAGDAFRIAALSQPGCKAIGQAQQGPSSGDTMFVIRLCIPSKDWLEAQQQRSQVPFKPIDSASATLPLVNAGNGKTVILADKPSQMPQLQAQHTYVTLSAQECGIPYTSLQEVQNPSGECRKCLLKAFLCLTSLCAGCPPFKA